MDIPQEEYDRIAGEIASAESVVGIDAKKTHIMILHLLHDIRRRLDRLEARIGAESAQGGRR